MAGSFRETPMRISTGQPALETWWVESANDRFKARARTYLARSIVAAVALHALLFLWSPNWVPSALESPASAGPSQLEVVALGPYPDPGSGGFVLALALEEGEDSEAEEDLGEEAEGGEEVPLDAFAGGPGGSGGDLARLAALTPQVVDQPSDPEPDPEVRSDDQVAEGPTSDGDEADGFRRPGSELDYERLSREEILDLERLSALRPELAFSAPSNWILLQNPSEVAAFLSERFGYAEARTRPRGSFSVAVWVDERGSVEWAEINQSSGHQELDRSALQLFREVVAFRPAREEGLRVPTAGIFWLSYW
jgi:TonB family protein